MQVSRTRPDNLSEFLGASRLSIEGYVRRVGSNLKFGSGYVVHDGGRFESSGNAPVVVNAVFDGSRGLQVESIQSVKFSAAPEPGSDPSVPGGAPDTPRGHPDAPRFGPGPGTPGGVGGLGHSNGGGSGQGGGMGHSGGGASGQGGGFGGSGTSHGGGRH
jgi:hypothetical protein